MSLLRSALDCARRGWRVVPLHGVDDQGNCSCSRRGCKAGKHPRIRGWREAATRSEDQIRKWWGAWPDSNVGVVTGAGSGVVVLDIDPKRGGEDTLAAIESEHGRLPATVESMTGGGGRHIWLAHPGGQVAGGADRLGLGVDVCGDGQLVVAPESRHGSGRTYEWELSSHPDDVEVQPMPDALVRLMRAPSTDARKPRGGFLFPGERNCTLTSMAGFAVMGGLAPEAVSEALHEHNRLRCKPPLSKAEVDDIARSAGRWERPLWISHRQTFFSDPALNAKDRMVLVALTTYAKPDGTCHPGYRKIADLSGVSKSQLRKHIERLEQAGRIEVDRSGRFHRYRIVNALPADCVRRTLVVQSQQLGQRGCACGTAVPLAEVAA